MSPAATPCPSWLSCWLRPRGFCSDSSHAMPPADLSQAEPTVPDPSEPSRGEPSRGWAEAEHRLGLGSASQCLQISGHAWQPMTCLIVVVIFWEILAETIILSIFQFFQFFNFGQFFAPFGAIPWFRCRIAQKHKEFKGFCAFGAPVMSGFLAGSLGAPCQKALKQLPWFPRKSLAI